MAQIDSLCPEAAVVVLLLGLRIGLGLRLWRLRGQNVDRVLISGIDISLLRWNRDYDFILILA